MVSACIDTAVDKKVISGEAAVVSTIPRDSVLIMYYLHLNQYIK